MNKKVLLVLCVLWFPLSSMAGLFGGSSCQSWNFQNVGTDEIATWKFKVDKKSDVMQGTGISTFIVAGGSAMYNLTATIPAKSSHVFIERSGSSDRNVCYYAGRKTDKHVEGTFICTAHTSSPAKWTADITKVKC